MANNRIIRNFSVTLQPVKIKGMMRRIVLLTVLAATVTLGMAQKKELGQARSYIKSGKDLDKAERLMTDLLKDAANRENKRIYETWFDAVHAQYAAANEKLYLKQQYDTAAFFGLTRRMYAIAETLDSLDMRPDEKGRVKPDFRKSHAEMLDLLRPNLYNGGTYHVVKNHHTVAYDFFDTYLDACRQPLFSAYDYAKSDTRLPQAAYWATFCGYKLQDAERTLRYCELALKDVSKAQYTMQYMCEAYQLLHRDADYVDLLHQGFERFPLNPYFFPRLADHYTAVNRPDSVLVIADEGLKANATHTLFLLAKSLALLELDRYDACIEVSQQLININGQLPEPYFNIATVYLNQALELEKRNNPRQYRQQLQDLYASARPYMEDYRRLQPDDQQRWAPALYRIYLNLNMGRQFEEIDRLMRKQ